MMPDHLQSTVGSVPSGWSVMPLGKVVQRLALPVDVEPEQTYREIGIRSHGKGIFHKEPTDGITLGDKRVFEVQPNCLIFNIVFAWEGAVGVTSERERGMIASHRFPMFTPTAENRVVVEFRLFANARRSARDEFGRMS